MRLPADAEKVAAVLGSADSHLRLLEDMFSATIVARGGRATVQGRDADKVSHLLQMLIAAAENGTTITEGDVRHAARALKRDAARDLGVLFSESVLTTKSGKRVRPRTAGQAQYVRTVAENELVFCIGPAGTGKTYLAMAMAIRSLTDRRVSRVILTKPVVEAGESLGYLPGDLAEKVDPFMRPLYDCLDEFIGPEGAQRHMARRTIEVLPLAYMRGRTLNEAFILLDEAQNTTPQQMKMFLTRLGFGGQMVVTGDITQIDLPADQPSGLVVARSVLRGIKGLAFVELTPADVVRHRLVQDIVEAYDRADEHKAAGDGRTPPNES
ncbi:MAG: PhoH family protein [Armatimonadota bacterium]